MMALHKIFILYLSAKQMVLTEGSQIFLDKNPKDITTGRVQHYYRKGSTLLPEGLNITTGRVQHYYRKGSTLLPEGFNIEFEQILIYQSSIFCKFDVLLERSVIRSIFLFHLFFFTHFFYLIYFIITRLNLMSKVTEVLSKKVYALDLGPSSCSVLSSASAGINFY